MLEEIKEKVNQKVNQRHKDIIISVYKSMLSKHNEFCGCDYCILLDQYVKYKKFKVAVNRRIDDDWYTSNLAALNYRLEDVKQLELKIQSLKIEKDKLKIIE